MQHFALLVLDIDVSPFYTANNCEKSNVLLCLQVFRVCIADCGITM